MAGENLTNPSSNASIDKDNEKQNSVDATKDAGQDNPVADNNPLPTSSKHKYENIHDVPHPHFRWHAEALVDGHEVCRGIVKDISMKGVNFYPDHNLQNAKLLKLQIHIPPLVVTAPHHILEVTGKITSTVYDSVEDSFRSGISFLEFTLESDRAYLLSRISEQ
jgi:hypothetical protein